ncbi:digestive cysteine proteinase 2-like [Tenebrio molitor]|jgi:cathepsin L|uniref:digestive cysteine proteinase 2-like n=1 Tax=Tenebrio molitor TaxID=7067 RepID=UPI0036247F0C
MKVFIILAIAIYGASAALPSTFVAEKWENFKTTYARSYVNAKEETFRKQIFQKKLETFEEHNEKYRQGLVSYTLGVNLFTDMTPEEMKAYTHGLIMPADLHKNGIPVKTREDLGLNASVRYPASFDWRDQGMVSPVKNQGSCGSCWAFSSTGAIESQMKIANGAGYDSSVSEQQLVDCVPNALGCSGGWMNDAFTYVAQNGGIDSEGAYPYEMADGNCHYDPNQVAARLSGYVYLSGPDENMLADMVATKGPVAVAFDADDPFGSYSGGVYYNPTCETNKFTHAVLIVGYGNENGQDYWLVKNSWGDGWGLDGYFKIARNANNHCGIAGVASVPTL